MTPDDLNFRHLLYFWTVARAGSIVRAADRLGMSAQAISTQLGQLEQQLGHALFAPAGRSLKLTEAGRTVLGHADQIFHTAEKLRESLNDAASTRSRFVVGISDAIPKLIAFHVLEPLLHPPLSVRLECHESNLDNLLGELALNRLDLVLSDRSAPERANLRLRSQLIQESAVGLFGSTDLQHRYATDFPACLQGAPMLLPARTDPLRQALDAWFAEHELRPSIIGEFSDSALLKTFARAGSGLFAAPLLMTEALAEQYAAHPLGRLDGVSERWYAISVPRRLEHPALARILDQAAALSNADQNFSGRNT